MGEPQVGGAAVSAGDEAAMAAETSSCATNDRATGHPFWRVTGILAQAGAPRQARTP